MFWRRDFLDERRRHRGAGRRAGRGRRLDQADPRRRPQGAAGHPPLPAAAGRAPVARRLAPPDALGAPAPLLLPGGLCAGGRRRRLLPLTGAAVACRLGRPSRSPRSLAWSLLGMAPSWLLARRYDWPVSRASSVLMVVRDLLLFPLWVAGWTGNTFVWRGNAMDIKTPRQRLRCDGLSSGGGPRAWYVRP